MLLTIMKKRFLTAYKAEKFLSKYLPTSKNQLVKSPDKITIKAPLVLKIISPQALHKSDIRGVRIIKDQKDIISEFRSLLYISQKNKMQLEGIMAQEYLEGEKIIIGIKKDPVFGHMILFGLGGIFTEVLDDIAVRKCPITMDDADDMINELRASKIFHGFRGIKLNINLLKSVLVKTSNIPLKHKDITELDINPFILNDKDGRVVDARIVF